MGFPLLKGFDALWLVFSFLFCCVMVCFNEELEIEGSGEKGFCEGFWGGGERGEQNLCTMPPPESDHIEVKVVQSHRVRCLGTCQTPHALVRKSVTV